MAYRTADELTDLQGDLTAVLAQIAALQAGILVGPVSGTISYIFDSGTGRQQEKFVSPIEASNALGALMARRDRLRRALSGQSLNSLRLRR